VVGGVLAALLGPALAACANSGSSILAPTTFTVSGTVDLTGNDGDHFSSEDFGYQSPCKGVNDYVDVTRGTQVIVLDDRERKVAVGALRAGRISNYNDDTASGTCTFAFSVTGVPASGKVYSVMVGHRPDFSFERSAATHVSLTLD